MSLTFAVSLRKSLQMNAKQSEISNMTSIPTTNMVELYNSPAPNIHYTLHNLFRGLKTIRRKYRLTINEIIFLNGMYLSCRQIYACLSQDACLKFRGPVNQSPPPAAVRGFLVFCLCQQAGKAKTKNPRALRAWGLVEVGGGFEPP